MRSALHLLILIAVLACGLHFGEAAEGHDRAVFHQATLEADASAATGEEGDDASGQSAESGHHHCPIAPDMSHGSEPCAVVPDRMLLAQRVDPLRSRAQAPLVEPPLA